MGSPIISVTLLIAALVSNCVLAGLLTVSKRTIEPDILHSEKVVPKGADALNYIATYIIPFTSLHLDKLTDALAISVLVVVLATLYVKADLIHINPMLNLAGYRIFEIELRSGAAAVYVITKSGSFANRSTIRAVNVAENIYLEVAQCH